MSVIDGNGKSLLPHQSNFQKKVNKFEWEWLQHYVFFFILMRMMLSKR